MSESSPFAAYPAASDADEPRPSYRSVRGFGVASMVLIAVVTILGVVDTAKTWTAYNQLIGYAHGDGTTLADALTTADTLDQLAVLIVVALLITGVVFLMWVFRARVNAEALGGADSQRRGRGWAVGGWICPIVNLWFPYQIMVDIYRASSGRRSGGTGIIGVWWAAMVVNVVLDEIVIRIVPSGDPLQSLHDDAVLSTVGSALRVVAAVLIVLIVNRISGWQNRETL